MCEAKPGVGSSHEKVIAAAKQIGLEIVEERRNATIEEMERDLDRGCLLIVNFFHAFDGDGHYAVATNYDAKSLYFADSSLGFLRLLKPDFESYWYNSEKTIRHWYVAVR
jgi:predicted double-glycine peptidase